MVAPDKGALLGALGISSERSRQSHNGASVAFITVGTAQVQSTYERAKVREIYRSSTGIKNENDETSLAAQKI